MSDTTALHARHRRVMDIEDILVWAYRDELTKRRDGEGLGGHEPCSVSPMFRNAVIGRVDNWSREPGMPAALGEPHPDAILVGHAVGELIALREQDHSGIEPDWLATDMAGLGGDQLAALTKAQRTVDLLVIVNARLRRRPPFETAPIPAPKALLNGKPAIVAPARITDMTVDKQEVSYDDLVPTSAIRGGVYENGARCPVIWSPDPQAILLERAEYAIWRAALTFLAEHLTGQLATISVLPPSAPARPWLGEKDAGKPAQVVRVDGRASVHRVEKRTADHRSPAPPRRRGALDRGRHLPRSRWPAALSERDKRQVALKP